MFVPISWIKDYVNIDNIDLKDFCDDMIMSGSNIEEVHHYGEGIKKVVVGKIKKIIPHPDADKLIITTVDVGEEELTIVTGAPNVKESDYVPVVKVGGWLPGGVKIKKGKLRGVESFGMLCSGEELGLSDSVIPIAHKDGIWILDQEYPLGMDIMEALGLNEDVVEFEITPNRPDCLSIIGMAREAAAVYKDKVNYPSTELLKEKDDISQYINIEIKNTELCKRYTAKVVKDIKIEQSPWWLQKRLICAGVRPINNIVDITNYVMLEYGQPLHAFDMRYLSGGKIIVDTAANGQIFTTLDDVERKLDSSMLLINDAEKGVGLAGVMGGVNSEVSDDTTTILLESANFNADTIRATSKKLGLRTEASARFEKGIDPNLCHAAVNRACKLIEEIGAGTVVAGLIDEYPNPQASEAKTIKVRCSRINDLLGTSMTVTDISDLFERLEMEVEQQGDDLLVKPPTARLDLKEEVDFLEEAARIYGYDELEMTVPKGNVQGGKSKKQRLEDLAKETLIALGLNEIQTYSFVSPKGADLIKVPEVSMKRNFVELLNPLGEENSVMRTSLVPNMMEVLMRNHNRNNPYAAAFELGKIFIRTENQEDLPKESLSLVAGLYGNDIDFYALKGIVEVLFQKIGLKNLEFIPETNHPTFHPGRCANIVYDNMYIGVLGELHPDVQENYDMSTRTYIFELNFDNVIAYANTDKYYAPLPKYPAMVRDIALVVEENVYVKAIEDIIKQNGGKLLEKIELFDIYRGKQVKEGFKSVAYSLTYRDLNKTLTEEEVSKAHSKVVTALEEQLSAALRD